MSLSVGLVPKIGLQHIQVGRDDEIAAIVTDLERIKDDGTTIRLHHWALWVRKKFLSYPFQYCSTR